MLVCLTYTKVQARSLADIRNDLAAEPLAELERCYLLAPDRGSIAVGRSGSEVVMGGLVSLDIGLRLTGEASLTGGSISPPIPGVAIAGG